MCPSAANGRYASAVRDALPHATPVFDHFHLDRLANEMGIKVHLQVTWTTAIGAGGSSTRSGPAGVGCTVRAKVTSAVTTHRQRLGQMLDICVTLRVVFARAHSATIWSTLAQGVRLFPDELVDKDVRHEPMPSRE